MHRIDTASAESGTPSYGVAGPVALGIFTEGLPGVRDGTIPGQDWFNQVMMELCNAITDDGGTLDKADDTQLASRLSPLKAIRSDASSLGSVTNTHRRAVIASQNSSVSGDRSLVMASQDSSASGAKAATVASLNCGSAGAETATLASNTCLVQGSRSAAIASSGSTTAAAGHEHNVALASDDASLTGDQGAIIASRQSVGVGGTLLISGTDAAVVASDGSTVAGDDSACVATRNCTVNASATMSFIAAAEGSLTDGDTNTVLAAKDCDARGERAAVIGSASSVADNFSSVLVASRSASLNDSYALAGGYSVGAKPSPGGNANLKWKANSLTGEITAASFTTGDANADVAEYVTNLTGAPIPLGILLALGWDDAGRGGVRPALPGELIKGCASGTAAFIANASEFDWAGRYARDDWGQRITRDVPHVRWNSIGRETVTNRVSRAAYVGPEDGAPTPIPDDATRWTATVLERVLVNTANDVANPALGRALDVLTRNLPPAVKLAVGKGLRKAQDALSQVSRQRVEYHPREVAHVAWPALIERDTTYTVEREGYDGPVTGAPEAPGDAVYYSVTVPVESADYDPTRPYVPRSARPEAYTCVGLLGQVRVRVAEDVRPGDALQAGEHGVAQRNGSYGRVLSILSPFDGERGFAIALCLV